MSDRPYVTHEHECTHSRRVATLEFEIRLAAASLMNHHKVVRELESYKNVWWRKLFKNLRG